MDYSPGDCGCLAYRLINGISVTDPARAINDRPGTIAGSVTRAIRRLLKRLGRGPHEKTVPIGTVEERLTDVRSKQLGRILSPVETHAGNAVAARRAYGSAPIRD
jgi:hypothetical protein